MTELNKKILRKFVFNYQCPSGGFSFSQTTPPTLEDTYYALGILRELGVEYRNKKTIEYLLKLDLANEKNMKNVYRYLYLLETLGLHRQLEEWKANLGKKPVNKSTENLYYMMLSEKIVGASSNRSQPNFYNPSSMKYVPEVSMAAELMKETKKPFNEKKYVRWLQEAQMPDGGYGFLLNSTSFVDTTYYALRGLKTLNSTPKDVEACRRFINVCRAREGFGRQIHSLPTLEATYHAVACLNMLKEMKK